MPNYLTEFLSFKVLMNPQLKHYHVISRITSDFLPLDYDAGKAWTSMSDFRGSKELGPGLAC